MNILFTICARAGSKGIKNKNIKDFLGYSLSFYTLSVIDLYLQRHEEHNCKLALNTDSVELIDIIKNKINLDIEIVKRNENLGKDDTPKVDVIRNTYEEIKKQKNIDFDIIVDLDITSPLRTLKDLENLIETKEKTNYNIVYSVTNSRRNPYFNMVQKTQEGYKRVLKSDFNCRQEAPEIFDMNASLYAYEKEFIIGNKNLFDEKAEVIKMLDTGILDLDHQNDFEFMQVIALYLFENKEDFKIVRDNIESILKK